VHAQSVGIGGKRSGQQGFLGPTIHRIAFDTCAEEAVSGWG
jgi:hypothetical protein